ncbi:histidine phosphatase family protein [Enterobacteriaceae bacterium BIT-l23]|uniref:histidine phosphatase family protein n=1 Tax=Jejubacter sp. L23 TaxID=3092086 RepID=UPI0015853763|nr:histidine phosphatase family protein [Enterobacteriaceae bacterium BIT-l23]
MYRTYRDKFISSILTMSLLFFSVICFAESTKGEFSVFLFRHGKTYFNETDQVQGWSDTPLTQKGIDDAKKTGEAFKNIQFHYAYTSDLGRARSTANYILAANNYTTPDLVEMEGLREVFYGSYEGKTNFEIMKPLFEKKNIDVTPENWADKYGELMSVSSEEWMINEYHNNDPTHTAETYNQVLSRTQASIDKITRDVLSRGGGNVLLVTHGEQIGMVLAYLFPDFKNDVAIKNGSLTLIKYRDGRYTLSKVGDVSHLK